MTAEEERGRLRSRDPEAPPGDSDTLVAACPDGAEAVLERVREVLDAVLANSGGPWPPLDDWKRLLPAWFVAACSDDVAVQSCVLDKWSLRAWIYWLQPEQRKWRWWGATAEGPDRLRIVLLVLARPYLRGSLEWLLKASGAASAG